MTGLDTNVLVRYIMQDDPRQSPMATQLIESLDSANPGYIALVSVVELYWVLTACFKLTDEQVRDDSGVGGLPYFAGQGRDRRHIGRRHGTNFNVQAVHL